MFAQEGSGSRIKLLRSCPTGFLPAQRNILKGPGDDEDDRPSVPEYIILRVASHENLSDADMGLANGPEEAEFCSMRCPCGIGDIFDATAIAQANTLPESEMEGKKV